MIPQMYLGWTALRAAHAGLDLVGQNIAHASNPDYHRQVLRQGTLNSVLREGHWYGTGVDIQAIQRMYDQSLAGAIISNTSQRTRYESHGNASQRIESLLLPSDGGLTGRTKGLFSKLNRLSSDPGDRVLRQEFIDSARNLTDELNRVSQALDTQRTDILNQVRDDLQTVQRLSNQLIDLNRQVAVARSQGSNPNTLLDQRDGVLRQLAELVDVQLKETENLVLLAGGSIVLGEQPNSAIDVQFPTSGSLRLIRKGDGAPLRIEGGRLAGLVQAYNDLATQQDRLDELARGFIRALDKAHSTGMGLSGSFRQLNSGRRVGQVHATLNRAQLPIAITAGELTVSVTETSTGTRTLHTISIDPAVDTLSSLASRLSAIPNLQAVANAHTGQLAIFSATGYTFDFTGGSATSPEDVTLLTGTTVPALNGVYHGPTNDRFTFEFSGPGEIGVTDGLSLLVRNQVGEVVRSLNVGAGYSPGSELEIAHGLKLKLSAGTVQAADRFSTRVVGQADTSDVLAALAINTLFVGDGARDLAIHPDILQDPGRLATGLSALAGDATNVLRLLHARDARVTQEGQATLEQFIAEIIARVGSQVQQLALESEYSRLSSQQLQAQREALSGVDADEELVRMLQYQRSFEAAAKYVSTINETLGELLALVR